MKKLVDKWHDNAGSTTVIPIKACQDILEWRQHNLSCLDLILQKEGPEGRLFLTCPHCGLECANKTVPGSHMAKMHAKNTRPTFDRLVHSVGSRPRCSGCKELLSSWDRLRKHIEHGACQFPVLEREQTQADTVADKTNPESSSAAEESSLPTAHHPEVHAIVQNGGWRELVGSVKWRKKLAQWCCLCGTWCASNRAVKMHIARTHKETWVPHTTRIELLCKSQQADIATPCSYCGSTSKEPKSHVIACPVIFQSILIDLLQHGSTSSWRWALKKSHAKQMSPALLLRTQPSGYA